MQFLSKFLPYFYTKVALVNIGAFLLIGLVIWFLAPRLIFAESVPFSGIGARLLLLMLVAVIWIAVFVGIKIFRDKKGLQTGEEDKAAQLARQQRELKKSINQAFTALRRVFNRGDKQKRFLQTMPWYLLMGLPDNGKTSVIINSGLKLSLRQHLNTELQARVDNLSQYEWWLTEDAVILDAAKYKGELVLEEEQNQWNTPLQNAAWMSVLKLLRRYRKERPISGVLVTVSLPDLLQKREADAKAYIHFIRQRIQSLHEQLGVCVPIYLILTKCDRISGFREFFAGLDQKARSQVWGITFPFNESADLQQVITFFDRAYGDMIARLSERLITELAKGYNLRQRERLVCFPTQMHLCKQPIIDLIKETFSASHYYDEDSIQLRGIYLTSAVQTGNPQDVLMDVMSDQYKLQRTSLPAQASEGKSYFLKNLFQQVIFPEAHLVGYSKRAHNQQERDRRLVWTSCAGVLVGTTLITGMAYMHNKNLLPQMSEELYQYQYAMRKIAYADHQESAVLPALIPLQNMADVYENASWSWVLGTTLREPRQLNKKIKDVLQYKVQQYMLPRVTTNIKHNMEQQWDNPDQLYDLLKAYLVLGGNQSIEPDAVHYVMNDIWEQSYAGQPQVQNQLNHFLDVGLGKSMPAQPIDQQLVVSAKHALADMVPSDQAYRLLLQNTENSTEYQLSVNKVLGPIMRNLFVSETAARHIPSLFTKKGALYLYPEQANIAAELTAEDNWQIGISLHEPTSEDIRRIKTQLRTLYIIGYGREWKKMLDSLQVRPFRNLVHGVEILDYVTGPDNPLQELLVIIEQQTYFSGTNADLNAPFTKLHAYDGEHLADARKALTDLRDYLLTIYSAPNTAQAQFNAAREYMQGHPDHPIRQVKLVAYRTPDPVQRWLNDLAQNSLNVLLQGVNTTISQAWDAELFGQYQAYVRNRYPLAPNATSEINLAQFSQFFGPNGAMPKFFSEYIEPFVDQSRPTWQWHEEVAQGVAIDRAVLAAFQQAHRINHLYFSEETGQPSVKFKLQPRSLDRRLSRVSLRLGNREMSYQHGPQRSESFEWPLDDNIEQAHVVLTDFEGRPYSRTFQGPWAWFRLLGQTRLQATDQGNAYVLNVELEGRRASFLVTSDQNPDLFTLSVLQGFNLPETV